jgi:hypothetical protein
MGYSDNTDKHLKIYAPDLGRTVQSSRLFVDELVLGGTVDLRLRNCVNGPQGTPIDFQDRKGRGRPRKTADGSIATRIQMPVIPPPQQVRVEVPSCRPQENIPMYNEDENGNLFRVDPMVPQMPDKRQGNEASSSTPEAIPETVLDTTPEAMAGNISETLPVDTNDCQPDQTKTTANTEAPQTSSPSLDPIQTTSEPMDENTVEGRYYFRERETKRKRGPGDDGDGEHRAKVIRSMIALILAEKG